MMPRIVLLVLLAVAAALVLLCLLGYWLLVVTEGSYLGTRAVSLLYDRTADSYEDIKDFDHYEEFSFLGRPLFDRLEESAGDHPLVLDVATGTARLPRALFDIPFFHGHVVALDASIGMLREATALTDDNAERCLLVHHNAAPLPFIDAAFDAVTMLEALEFVPDRAAVLRELTRVLRPGGWLLLSNRVGFETNLMPGKVDPPARFEARLRALGMTDVQTQPWQSYYALVWARKPGLITPNQHPPPATTYLRCPDCGQPGPWVEYAAGLRCRTCDNDVRRSGRVLRLA